MRKQDYTNKRRDAQNTAHMTEVEINTGENEIMSASVVVNRPDESPVVIDTAEDDFDNVVDEMPPLATPHMSTPASPHRLTPAPTPKPTQKKQQSPPRHSNLKQKKHDDKKKKAVSSERIEETLNENPRFAAAIYRTVPKETKILSEDAQSQRTEEEEVESEASYEPSKKRKLETRRGRKTTRDDDEEEEDDRSEKSVSHGDESEAATVEASETELPDVEDANEKDYIDKMRIIEEIKDFAKMGAVPPKQPTFDMPISLLRKIRDYQATVVDEILGVGFIGLGWIQIIGAIETLNDRFDPFAKAFGTGLKLYGSKNAISKNIHLYEGTFKHIYRKFIKTNNKEISPWVQMVTATIQILSEVHVHNMEQEMMKQAEAAARAPETRTQAAHLDDMFSGDQSRPTHNPPSVSPQTPLKPQIDPETTSTSIFGPPSTSGQPDITPVDETVVDAASEDDSEKKKKETPVETVVDLKQSPPAEEEPIMIESEDEKEGDSDDDVVVQIPKTRRRAPTGRKK